jgi:hypothetical protein
MTHFARLRRHHEAPLIGERAATKGGDAHAGVKSAWIHSSSSLANAPQRAGESRWKVAMSAAA